MKKEKQVRPDRKQTSRCSQSRKSPAVPLPEPAAVKAKIALVLPDSPGEKENYTRLNLWVNNDLWDILEELAECDGKTMMEAFHEVIGAGIKSIVHAVADGKAGSFKEHQRLEDECFNMSALVNLLADKLVANLEGLEGENSRRQAAGVQNLATRGLDDLWQAFHAAWEEHRYTRHGQENLGQTKGGAR